MKRVGDRLRLSATDLANHLACHHLTVLDRGAAEGRWKPPDWARPEAQVLADRGLEHERQYLEHLESHGRRITRLSEEGDPREALDRSLAAMQAGDDVIAQATLAHGRWLGRADVLLKVDRPSRLGSWSYEVLDTKLARETKAGAILQLCLYSELLAELQGAWPEAMHVVPRRPGFASETHRVADYAAYYRLVRRRLEDAVSAAPVDGATYPEPVPHCDVCRWWPTCDGQRRGDDHLSLVAGISRVQIRELQGRTVTTLARLAIEPLPIAWKPTRGAKEGYGRVREQARVQLEGRTTQRPVHELLGIEPGRGLANLPSPSPGDLFLDFEGDPYVDDGGIEYLFGWAVADPPPPGTLALETGPLVYHHHWALDRAAERRAFETLIDTILARWALDPQMHVYHYGVYEPATIKRLMGRYATRGSEVDRMLRAGRFVDLHAVVKQSLRASVEQYSIKALEPFYAFDRQQALDRAGVAQRVIQRGLELGLDVDPESEDAAIVMAYNRDDCMSTKALRDWLETLHAAHCPDLPRPVEVAGDPNAEISDRERHARELADRLLVGVPDDPAERTDEHKALWLLATLLDWHRREEKAPWWEYFRLRELSDEELLDERHGLSGLEFVERLPLRGRSKLPIDRYRFPAQETDIRDDDVLHLPTPAGCDFGDVVDIDPIARIVDIKKRGACADVHPASVFAHDTVPVKEQPASLMRLGEWVADHGIDGPGPHRATRDLLLGRGPRVAGHSGGALQQPGETGQQAARRLALRLDHGVLAIQGPPGSGKTFTGAHMICDLLREGRRVGVCAHSHKVIRNLLMGVVAAALHERVALRCVQKVREPGEAVPGIVELKDNAEVLAALQNGRANLAGGTAWMWARADFAESVDVLFVDEAGQMALANVLAIAPAGRDLVLLGDPRQLEQPLQGTHPDGAEVSALEHMLQGHMTIPADRGLFLAETWRLPPEICRFTSELFYEGRLASRDSTAGQELIGAGELDGAGLWFVPVDHDANQSASREEVEVVARLVESLLGGAVTWRDGKGVTHPLELDDLLMIAPYNAQVADLIAALPDGARVGTVDRFQGQEAPVVICSMTTSAPADVPHGMEFLYSPNRFNVATSRAQCVCIVVGSPRLFEPDCRSPKQMKLANAFCRFVELARQATVRSKADRAIPEPQP